MSNNDDSLNNVPGLTNEEKVISNLDDIRREVLSQNPISPDSTKSHVVGKYEQNFAGSDDVEKVVPFNDTTVVPFYSGVVDTEFIDDGSIKGFYGKDTIDSLAMPDTINLVVGSDINTTLVDTKGTTYILPHETRKSETPIYRVEHETPFQDSNAVFVLPEMGGENSSSYFLDSSNGDTVKPYKITVPITKDVWKFMRKILLLLELVN